MIGKRQLRECLVRAALATLVAALVGLVDPMGLDEATDRHSADVVSRMTALSYGGQEHKGRQQVAVIEVTDHTLTASGLDWPPPRFLYRRILQKLTSRDDLAEILPPGAAAGRPAAVFFDYVFISKADVADEQSFVEAVRTASNYDLWRLNRQCQKSPLDKLKCIHKAGGVPVIVGKGYPPNACLAGEKRAEKPREVALAHVAVVVPLAWPDLPTRFQPVLTAEDYAETLKDQGWGGAEIAACDEVWRGADLKLAPAMTEEEGLASDPTAQSEGRDRLIWAPLGLRQEGPLVGYDLSPATAMAYAICLRRGGRAELCDPLTQAQDRTQVPVGLHLMTLSGPEWGSVTDPLNADFRKRIYGPQAGFPDPACQAERLGLRRALAVGWRQLTSGLGDGAAATAVPCPYHLTLDADALFGLSGTQLAGLRAALKDRAIAIGAAQSLSNDWIATPLSARRAGVHYHAMSLDNLLEYGADLRHQPPVVAGWIPALKTFDWGDVVELACLFGIALLVERTRQKVEPAKDRGRWAQRESFRTLWKNRLRDARKYWRGSQGQRYRMVLVGRVLVIAALVLFAAAWGTLVLRWEPVNVVGLAGATLLVVAFELWTHDGWGAVVGFLAALLVLGPGRVAGWFGRPAPLAAARTRRSERQTRRAASAPTLPTTEEIST